MPRNGFLRGELLFAGRARAAGDLFAAVAQATRKCDAAKLLERLGEPAVAADGGGTELRGPGAVYSGQ